MSNQSYDVPILLIVWRRADLTRRLLNILRTVKPSLLFLACDGPRSGYAEDATQIAAVHKLLELEIDWTCQIQRRYSLVNQGCGAGPKSAIDWFFCHVEAGIILEDDCHPHPDFFAFCAEMLTRYSDDQRVFSISGSNFQQGADSDIYSYYFSVHSCGWGWATWRRAWQHHANALTLWPAFRDHSAFQHLFPDPVERAYWCDALDDIAASPDPFSDVWDFQWSLACWLNRGLAVVPNRNLISNCGFGDGSTHCKGEAWFAALSTVAFPPPYLHPALVLPDSEADRRYFLTRCNGYALHLQRRRRRWGILYPLLEQAATAKKNC